MATNQQSQFGPLWMQLGTHDLIFFRFFWVKTILFRWKTLRSECLQFSMDGIKFQISMYNFDWNQFALNSRDHGKIFFFLCWFFIKILPTYTESLFQLFSTIFKNNNWQRLGFFSKYSLGGWKKQEFMSKQKCTVELQGTACNLVFLLTFLSRPFSWSDTYGNLPYCRKYSNWIRIFTY